MTPANAWQLWLRQRTPEESIAVQILIDNEGGSVESGPIFDAWERLCAWWRGAMPTRVSLDALGRGEIPADSPPGFSFTRDGFTGKLRGDGDLTWDGLPGWSKGLFGDCLRRVALGRHPNGEDRHGNPAARCGNCVYHKHRACLNGPDRGPFRRTTALFQWPGCALWIEGNPRHGWRKDLRAAMRKVGLTTIRTRVNGGKWYASASGDRAVIASVVRDSFPDAQTTSGSYGPPGSGDDNVTYRLNP